MTDDITVAMDGWIPIEKVLPQEGQTVETMIADQHGRRNLARLRRRGRLWFTGEMYVYYAPTHWRPVF